MEVFRIIPEDLYLDLKLKGLLNLENKKLPEEVEENKNTENSTSAQTSTEPICNWINFDSKFKWKTEKTNKKKKLKKNT